MNQNKKDNLFQLSIFTFSLLGVFLTLYLHFEQLNNFEQGCTEGFDCKDVINSFKLLGLSNIYWGLIYYISILLFGLIPLISKLSINQTIIKLRNYLIIFGAIYSIFLISYQYFKLEEFCSLCLMSSLICFTLLVILIFSGFLKTHSIPNHSILKKKIMILFTSMLVITIYYFSGDSNNKVETKNNITYNIPILGSVELGNHNAKVTIIKWTDFQCPYCAKSVTLIDQILDKYPNDVKIIIKNYPLDSHQEAYKAAQYALAAHQQGKFKEMYHLIFENYQDLKENEDLPIQYAKKINLNMNRFMRDFENQLIINQIEREKKEMRDQFDQISLPTFLIQGKILSKGQRNLDAISKIIDMELLKK